MSHFSPPKCLRICNDRRWIIDFSLKEGEKTHHYIYIFSNNFINARYICRLPDSLYNSMANIIVIDSFVTQYWKGKYSRAVKEIQLHRKRRIFYRWWICETQYTYPSTRAVSRRKAKIKHIEHVVTAAATRSDREVLYLQRVGWERESGFSTYIYRERGEERDEEEDVKRKMCLWISRLPKSRATSP